VGQTFNVFSSTADTVPSTSDIMDAQRNAYEVKDQSSVSNSSCPRNQDRDRYSQIFQANQTLIDSVSKLWAIIFSSACFAPTNSVPWKNLSAFIFSTPITSKLWSNIALYDPNIKLSVNTSINKTNATDDKNDKKGNFFSNFSLNFSSKNKTDLDLKMESKSDTKVTDPTKNIPIHKACVKLAKDYDIDRDLSPNGSGSSFMENNEFWCRLMGLYPPTEHPMQPA
jgi:hypothetical protein